MYVTKDRESVWRKKGGAKQRAECKKRESVEENYLDQSPMSAGILENISN